MALAVECKHMRRSGGFPCAQESMFLVISLWSTGGLSSSGPFTLLAVTFCQCCRQWGRISAFRWEDYF